MQFDFKEDYVLQDEMVLLRPLQISDSKHLMSFAMDEPEIWKYSMLPVNGRDSLYSYIGLALHARTEGREYAFTVFDKRTHEYAGSSRFYDIQLKQKTLQLGYTWYGKKFQGSGLNKHCKYLMLSFAFDQLGMERVEFRADNENERSKAAMRSIGCKTEGILRSSSYRQDGSRRDSIVLSILRPEWEQEIKAMLAQKIKC